MWLVNQDLTLNITLGIICRPKQRYDAVTLKIDFPDNQLIEFRSDFCKMSNTSIPSFLNDDSRSESQNYTRYSLASEIPIYCINTLKLIFYRTNHSNSDLIVSKCQTHLVFHFWVIIRDLNHKITFNILFRPK